jgi:hypothetical protein
VEVNAIEDGCAPEPLGDPARDELVPGVVSRRVPAERHQRLLIRESLRGFPGIVYRHRSGRFIFRRVTVAGVD